MDDLSPEGTRIKKLRAHAGSSGFWSEKYRSRWMSAAIRNVLPAPIGRLNR